MPRYRRGITPTNLTVTELPISDHKAVLFYVPAPISKAKEQRTISFRNIKHINPTDLITLINSYPSPSSSSSPADLANHYNDCLSPPPSLPWLLRKLAQSHLPTLPPGSPPTSASSNRLAVVWSSCTKRLDLQYTSKCTLITVTNTRPPSPLPNPPTTPTLHWQR